MAMFNSYVAVYQRVHISIWKSMNPHPTHIHQPQGTDLSDGRYAHSAVLREGGAGLRWKVAMFGATQNGRFE